MDLAQNGKMAHDAPPARALRDPAMEQKRKIVPPIYLLFTLLAMAALHFGVPVARIIHAPYTYAGAVLIVLGISITATAARGFARAGTPIIPFEPSTALVTSGLYRMTRNPMYVGMVVALLGAGVCFGTLSPFLPIPLFVWIIQKRFIVGEEKFLEEIFGAQYLDYKSKVRRWI
jgi:protein-S-isoprenylcysteine O-methyltransferase Ste14